MSRIKFRMICVRCGRDFPVDVRNPKKEDDIKEAMEAAGRRHDEEHHPDDVKQNILERWGWEP